MQLWEKGQIDINQFGRNHQTMDIERSDVTEHTREGITYSTHRFLYLDPDRGGQLELRSEAILQQNNVRMMFERMTML